METAALPHSLGVLSRLAAERAAKAGADVNALKKAANLPHDLEVSDARISAQSQTAFLNLVAEATGDDLLGFHIALEFEMRRLGPLYYVMASTPTVREALAREEQYTWTVTEGMRNTLHDAPSVLIVETTFVGMERYSDRHQIEFWITCTLRKVRDLTANFIVPVFVEWKHQRVGPVDEMQNFFGVKPVFGAGSDRLGFSQEVAALPLKDPDPHLQELLRSVLDDSESARSPNALRTRIEDAITPRLPRGDADQETIARELGMSKRTLIRKLGEAGLTFRVIMDELREKLAVQYLRDGVPQAQIAWLLGFREPKAFSRAFRRWTGATPSAYRQTAGERNLRFEPRDRRPN